jgi:hypothetical protein
MNEFRTLVKLKESDVKISYDSTLLFMGSCFSENIGIRFKERRFSSDINPFGVLYNPESVRQGLDILMENRLFSEEQLFNYGGLWHSFYHHSRFSGPEKKSVLDNINQNITDGHLLLKRTEFLFITFGTAWVYQNTDDGKIVANCHKLPASRFKRFRLGVEDIVESYKELIERLKRFSPGIKIIFTVSPVRHLKDGAHGNQLSKAVLLLATEELVKEFKSEVLYFPAYELLMDDLRDYRFYADDMVHPGNVAVEYIWENLSDAWFDQKAKAYVAEISKIIRARKHRPFNENSTEYVKFVENTLKRLSEIKRQFRGVDIEPDILYFKKMLNRN